MTTEEKNIAIAKMLGWKKNNLLWNTDANYDEYAYLFDNELLFHSDANWQDEVINYLAQKGYKTDVFANNSAVAPVKWSCTIWIQWLGGPHEYFVETDEFLIRKEAIFEALYQFSQYLKK